VDIESGVIRVLEKSQTAGEEVQLPSQARPALERYRKILDPPTDEWPMFPTRHAPSLYECVRAELGDRVDDLEADLKAEDPDVVLYRYEIVPPSITAETVRNIFRRLYEEGENPVKGEHEYLKPHGARRGAGEALYRAEGSSVAQIADNDFEHKHCRPRSMDRAGRSNARSHRDGAKYRREPAGREE
jgi:hypothetical protein